MANTLPQSKLEELKATLHKIYKRRFRKPNEPKYGSINKGFTDQELQLFFRTLKSKKFRLLFKISDLPKRKSLDQPIPLLSIVLN